MKEKKTIGFDILDNAGLNEIDKIGTDIDMLDVKTKKRILEMTRKRYNDAIKGENTGIFDNTEDVVENVEVYNRSKIKKIMTGVVNTAAALGLAVGSVFLVKNLGRGDNDTPDEPLLPSESTTFSTESNNSKENLSQEEIARNQRIEDFIRYVYVSHNKVLDKEHFNETLKIEYAYLDINNDSVDELLIRYDFLNHYYFGLELNYFDGTGYIPFDDIQYASKFDLQNRKLYELYDGYEYEGFENEFFMDVKTWENTEISCDVDFFTYQENYHYYMYEGELFYTHNGEQCTEEELKTAKAEYENCDNAGLKFIPYIPDDSFFLENSVNNTANGQSAEETARNKRIEEYIDYLCYYCDGESDKDKFYDTIKIDYAYLDINNDSVDELFIRYHNLNDFSPYYEGTELNYFDGTKYIPVDEMNTTFKLDLQNRKLYQLSESHEGGYSLYIRTWENSKFSDNMDFFELQEDYHSNVVNYEELEYSYTHNNEPCTKEEHEKAMDEYENLVGAKLNYIPYTVKKSAGNAVQTQTVSTTKKATAQPTIAISTPKPTQEVLDKARDAALKARFDKHDKNNYVSMHYAYYDINDDSVPELLISNEYNVSWEMEIYKFNGTEFEFKTAFDYNLSVKFCKSEKLVEGCEKNPSMVYSISRYDDELNFSAVDRVIAGYNYDENGNMYDEYRFNDKVITKEEYRSHIHECDNCEILSNDVEFSNYNTNDPNYNEKLSREQLINNFDSEGVYDSMCYAYTDLNADGKSELIILCDDFDTNKATVNIYRWENGSYVFKTGETNFTFKIDLENKRIYFVDDYSGTVLFMFYYTWDENCNMKFVKQFYSGDEGFDELLAEYEACEDIYLEYIQCW